MVRPVSFHIILLAPEPVRAFLCETLPLLDLLFPEVKTSPLLSFFSDFPLFFRCIFSTFFNDGRKPFSFREGEFQLEFLFPFDVSPQGYKQRPQRSIPLFLSFFFRIIRPKPGS